MGERAGPTRRIASRLERGRRRSHGAPGAAARPAASRGGCSISGAIRVPWTGLTDGRGHPNVRRMQGIDACASRGDGIW